MAKMAAAGHRVVLVVATGGEEGEVDDGFLEPGESLGERRRAEVHAAARVLDVSRVVFLGYHDSGMMGEPTNGHPDCFWQVGVEAAALRLAAILAEEGADVLTVYDDHGGYGHPDHIQVHRVGHRAAEIAGTARVFEATINRDRVRLLRELAPEGADESAAAEDGEDWFEKIGLPESEITTVVDVSAYLDTKKRAMLAHASQVAADSWFFSMGDDVFTSMWGSEWFRRTEPAFEGELPRDREDTLV